MALVVVGKGQQGWVGCCFDAGGAMGGVGCCCKAVLSVIRDGLGGVAGIALPVAAVSGGRCLGRGGLGVVGIGVLVFFAAAGALGLHSGHGVVAAAASQCRVAWF